MKPAIMLDATPLGLLAQRRGIANAEECREWLASLRAAGYRVLVPEIADYEVRRELVRARKTAGIQRLDAFIASRPNSYVALTTSSMRQAAQFWAQARQQGYPTASSDALDGDAILAAQAVTLLAPGGVLIATANVAHLTRFVPAELWSDIRP